jgi:hypothetical protein
MRSAVRWFVVLVLAADAVVALLVLGSALLGTSAATAVAPPSAKAEPASPAAPASAATTPAPLPVQPRAEAKVPEPPPVKERIAAASTPGPVMPDSPVLRAAGDETDAAIPGTVGADAAPPIASEPKAAKGAAKNQAFVRLQRAYESMEPESAAKALVALAARDKEVVIDLLMGWKPRTSGAILDAVTQNNAGLAADLSYEIWRRSGNPAEPAARSGR